MVWYGMEPIDPNAPPRMLSKEDIHLLLTDRSAHRQLDVVSKLAEHYTMDGRNAMNVQQMAIAHDIFGLLMSRGDMIVRATLSMYLSQTDRLPQALAHAIANDANADVAGPMLQYSEVLTDDDLARIISSMVEAPKLEAIARRRTVSETISDLLVSTNLEQVVCALVQNEGASIPVSCFDDIIQHFNHDVNVMEALIQRSAIPLPVMERAISVLPPHVRGMLEKHHGNLNVVRTSKRNLSQHLEQSMLKVANFKTTDMELMRLIQLLDKSHKLPLYSALGMCNLQLFEVCMSRVLRIPLKNVKLLLQDEQGFNVAFERAVLPVELRDATGLAVRALRALDAEQANMDIHQLPGLQQVMARMRLLAGGQRVEGVERVFAIMQHFNR